MVYTGERNIGPLVEAALNNELQLIEVGISKTEHNLKRFEEKYAMNTIAFISDYENDKPEETMEFIEWIGEFKMPERLIDKSERLKSIRAAQTPPMTDIYDIKPF